jgi:hypothetical protein
MLKKRINFFTRVCVLFLALLKTEVFSENTEDSTQPYFKDLTILVTSCDKYEELWNPFLTLMHKFWPDLNQQLNHVPVLFISNKKKPSDPRIQNIQIIDEKSWSDNMLEALNHVKSKYVLIFLEDYLINKPINSQLIYHALGVLEEKKGAYFQTSYYHRESETVFKKDTLDYIAKEPYENFRTSLQACIWNVEALKFLLRSGESAWDFESPGSVRSQGYPAPFFTVTQQTNLISYVNGAHLGHLNQYTLDFLKKHNITIAHRHLPLAEDHKIKLWWTGYFKPYLYSEIYVPIRDFILTLI